MLNSNTLSNSKLSGDISGPLVAPLTEKQVQNLWLDIARNVMQRVKRLAFKNPTRKKELDTMTFFLNKQYEEVWVYTTYFYESL